MEQKGVVIPCLNDLGQEELLDVVQDVASKGPSHQQPPKAEEKEEVHVEVKEDKTQGGRYLGLKEERQEHLDVQILKPRS